MFIIWCWKNYGNIALERPQQKFNICIEFIDFSYLYAIKSPIRSAAFMEFKT